MMELADFGVLRQVKGALGGGKGGSRGENCNLQDQRMAAGCILNRAGEPKMEIPDEMLNIKIQVQ
jgi:hypothetical protein